MYLNFKDGWFYPHLTQNFDFVLKNPFVVLTMRRNFKQMIELPSLNVF